MTYYMKWPRFYTDQHIEFLHYGSSVICKVTFVEVLLIAVKLQGFVLSINNEST